MVRPVVFWRRHVDALFFVFMVLFSVWWFGCLFDLFDQVFEPNRTSFFSACNIFVRQ